MSHIFEPGEKVTYSSGHGSCPSNLTEGRIYTVLGYDPNDGDEWPDGCTGTPFVTVLDDNCERFSGFSYRFQPAPEKESLLVFSEEHIRRSSTTSFSEHGGPPS